jgi:hypothetical protein
LLKQHQYFIKKETKMVDYWKDVPGLDEKEDNHIFFVVDTSAPGPGGLISWETSDGRTGKDPVTKKITDAMLKKIAKKLFGGKKFTMEKRLEEAEEDPLGLSTDFYKEYNRALSSLSQAAVLGRGNKRISKIISDIRSKLDRDFGAEAKLQWKEIKKRKLKEATSTQMECMECGKRFKKKIGPKTVEVKCPKCGGYDTEPA